MKKIVFMMLPVLLLTIVSCGPKVDKRLLGEWRSIQGSDENPLSFVVSDLDWTNKYIHFKMGSVLGILEIKYFYTDVKNGSFAINKVEIFDMENSAWIAQENIEMSEEKREKFEISEDGEILSIFGMEFKKKTADDTDFSNIFSNDEEPTNDTENVE